MTFFPGWFIATIYAEFVLFSFYFFMNSIQVVFMSMFTIIYIYQKIGNSSGDIGVHVSMWRNTETIRNETIDSDIL